MKHHYCHCIITLQHYHITHYPGSTMTSPATRCTRWPSSPRGTRALTSPASQGGKDTERRCGLWCISWMCLYLQRRSIRPHPRAEDGRGEEPGPGGAAEGGHERFPRQHEEDEEVCLPRQPRTLRDLEPQVWGGVRIMGIYITKCNRSDFNKASILNH